jgi:hypothetical protein
MREKKIIYVANGGLGDNLAFSTLPEEFSRQNNAKVYVHYKSKFRNKEIYDLVWGCNPYVIGKSQKIANAGSSLLNLVRYPKKFNAIQNAEVLHNLKLKNKYPKIYYNPKKIENLQKVFLVDISAVSIFYTKKEIYKIQKVINRLKKKFVNHIFLNIQFKNKITSKKKLSLAEKVKFIIKTNFMPNSILAFGQHDNHFYYSQNLDGNIEINSIFEYCDMINSCSGLISLHHGQSHLSSAIKNQYSSNLKSFCIIQKKIYNFHKSGMHSNYIFDNINYITI